MWTWPSSPAMPGGALDDAARLDDAAAQPGAHDRRDRRVARRLRAEAGVVRVEGGRVAVVVVDDGQPQPRLEGAAEVEAAPARVGEVGRALARRSRRRRWPGPGVSRPTARTRVARDAGALQDVRRRPATSASTATSGPSCTRLGVSTSRSTRKLADGIEHGRVVLVAAVVEADDDPRVLDWHARGSSARRARQGLYPRSAKGRPMPAS